MEALSNNVWATLAVGFVAGAIVAYIFLRLFKRNVQNAVKLERELAAAKETIEAQKQQLSQHFSTSAELLANLADDYKKLYSHLASSSEQLLPEASQQIAFFKQAQITHTDKTEEGQPKDYSEGSSGLLKTQN